MRILWLVWLIVVALLTAPASAQSFPPLSGRVVDAADLLDAQQVAELTRLSESIEQASSRQFVVATVPDLQGYEIEDYGYRLGRAWRIGQDGANNGIVLLVAPKERRVRIEVGYGLEPIMTDALASTIIRDTILPRFRDGDMPGGIIAGANAIGEQMKLPLEAAEARAKQQVEARPARRNRDRSPNFVMIVFWIAVLLFILLPMLRSGRKGRRYRRGRAPVVIWGPGWGGGGSSWGGGGGGFGGGGGGGFSGGGGSFGGGGASGGW